MTKLDKTNQVFNFEKFQLVFLWHANIPNVEFDQVNLWQKTKLFHKLLTIKIKEEFRNF